MFRFILDYLVVTIDMWRGWFLLGIVIKVESLFLFSLFYWIWFSSLNINKTHKKGLILLIAIKDHSNFGRYIPSCWDFGKHHFCFQILRIKRLSSRGFGFHDFLTAIMLLYHTLKKIQDYSTFLREHGGVKTPVRNLSVGSNRETRKKGRVLSNHRKHS